MRKAAGPSRGCLLAIALALPLYQAHTTSHVDIIDLNGDVVSKLAVLLPDRDISIHDLPIERPSHNSEMGWTFCDWSCMNSSVIRTGDAGNSKGVYEIELTFKPLPGVTSSMMVWLFQNLHKQAVSAADNKTYPMYLLFHGVDHLHHEAYPADKPVAVGSSFTWCEMPLTGCQYHPESATAPWTCPPQRQGFVKSDLSLAWQFLFHTKVNMTITKFDQFSIEFVSRERNPFFGGKDLTRTVATTRHSWTDSEQGLLLKTQQWLGFMKPDSTTDYDESVLAPIINKIIRDTYIDGAWNMPQNNITAAGYMAMLHYLQEYGTLPKWLPPLYKAAQQQQ